MALAETVRTYEELLQFLTELGVTHRATAEAQTVDVDVGGGPAAALHLRWERTLPFLQIIQPILTGVPEARAGEIEAAVVTLNNAAVFPGLGFDRASGRLYYRITAPILVDGVRTDLLQAYLRGAVASFAELRGALVKVVAGLPGRDVLRELT